MNLAPETRENTAVREVIAIISTLEGLSMTILNSANEKAKTISHISSKKQLIFGFASHLSEIARNPEMEAEIQ